MRSIALALLVAFASVSTAWADGAEVGGRAPEFDSKARTDKNKKFQLKSLRGKWVVVTIGASWCKPCRKELPAWDALAKRYKGKVTFVAVNINNKKKDGEAFMKKMKVKNMKIVYSPQSSTSTGDAYVGGDDPKFPTTFVIDPEGIVRHVHKSYHSGDSEKLAKKIDDLLAK
jgi:thiol-disulfide isomerase/thioredoxin